jgi:predicted RNA-binding protein
MKKGKLIYFPLVYIPSMEDKEKFWAIQAEMYYCSTEVYNQSRDRMEQVIRVERLANRIREMWLVIDGGKSIDGRKEIPIE